MASGNRSVSGGGDKIDGNVTESLVCEGGGGIICNEGSF